MGIYRGDNVYIEWIMVRSVDDLVSINGAQFAWIYIGIYLL